MTRERLLSHHRLLLQEDRNGIFSNSQRGFISGVNGCPMSTFVLRELIDATHHNNNGVVLTWIDFKNAFGSVDVKLIRFCLKWLRVPVYLQNIICDIYSGSSNQIRCGRGEWTENILLERGVKQGCGLSPLVFNCCLEPLLRWLNINASATVSNTPLASKYLELH